MPEPDGNKIKNGGPNPENTCGCLAGVAFHGTTQSPRSSYAWAAVNAGLKVLCGANLRSVMGGQPEKG